MKVKKSAVSGLFVFALVTATVFLNTQSASAVSYGGTGYFSGNPAQTTLEWNEDVFPGRTSSSSPDTIPNSATNKAGFIDYIERKLNGNSQEKTAAAYVINTMVGAGKDAKSFNKQRNPSEAMIENWKKRINEPDIKMSTPSEVPNRYGRISFYDHSINDVFLTNYNSSSRPLIVFKQGTKVVYVVEKPCGNPVGELSLPEPKDDWDVTPKTVARKSGVKPGENIPWDHTLKKTGSDNTTDPISWEIKQFKKDNGEPNKIGTTIDSGVIPKNRENGNILSKPTNYTALPGDLSKRICQYIRIKPYAMVASDLKDSSFRSSTPECVPVKNNVESGDFTPSATVYTDFTEPNTNYEWNASVTGGYIPQSSHPHPLVSQDEDTILWEVHKIVYPSNNTSDYVGGSGSFDCPVAASCTQEESPPGYARKNGGSKVPDDGSRKQELVPDDMASGSRICYVSSVKLPKGLDPYEHWYDNYETEQIGTDENGNPIYGPVNHPYMVNETVYKDPSTRKWSHSAADCVTIAKRPRAQIQGEDAAVRGDIIMSYSTYADEGRKTFGSWIEYGAFSLGENDFAASGAAYSEGPSGGVNRPAWSKLTFANDNPTSYGGFGALPEPPKIADYYASKAGAGWVGLSGPSGIFKVNGNMTISSPGVSGSYVVYSDGDVTIDDDIIYNDGPFAFGAKLPQVIIIAKNIKIRPIVKQVDAWLITTVAGVDHGSVNTCTDGVMTDTAPLTDSGICAEQLIINGPVVTGNLLLRRTYGARPGLERGTPAEILRLRPDAYLWGYQQSSSNSVAQTVDISELPPRF